MAEPDDDTARAKLVDNERTKLSATYTNGLAVAVFAVGGLSPIVSVLFSPTPSTLVVLAAIGFSLICQAASLALHSLARRLLRKLVP